MIFYRAFHLHMLVYINELFITIIDSMINVIGAGRELYGQF